MTKYASLIVLVLFSALSDSGAQTNTVQLINGSNTTTLLPSATTTVNLQIPSLSDGSWYIATSPIDQGAGGILLTDTMAYGATAVRNTLAIDGMIRLFDVSYANSAVNNSALGARIVSSATGVNSGATGLSISAGASGSSSGTGLHLSAASASGLADALYISSGRFAMLESTGATYRTDFYAGDQNNDIAYVLPVSDGSVDQFLTTDASGNLAWVTPIYSLDNFSDAKSGGANFLGSMVVGNESTGTLNNASFNTGLGVLVFRNLTSGSRSTAVGYRAYRYDASGSDNVAVGNHWLVSGSVNRQRSTAFGETAHNDANGVDHVSLGYEVGFSNTSTTQGNTVVGYRPFRNSTSGNYIIAVGYDVMYTGGGGSHNIAIGRNNLQGNSAPQNSGSYNIALGGNTGLDLTTANTNLLLGYNSASPISTGAGNVVIGSGTGDDLSSGSTNVIIGNQVGSNNSIDTESNLFLIDNSNTTTPLLQGDFTNSAEYLKINGDLRMSGGITLATGADQTVTTDAATVDATAYSAVRVVSDNDTDADVITITGGNNGMVMYIDFINTGDNDVSIGGVTHAITNTKSAGITVCRINGTWRVVGIAEY